MENLSQQQTFVLKTSTTPYHGVIVEAPILPHVSEKKSTFECPGCLQQYSERRLDSHKCEPHLKQFKPVKKSSEEKRYLYRCQHKNCHWEGRLSSTKSHSLMH